MFYIHVQQCFVSTGIYTHGNNQHLPSLLYRLEDLSLKVERLPHLTLSL